MAEDDEGHPMIAGSVERQWLQVRHDHFSVVGAARGIRDVGDDPMDELRRAWGVRLLIRGSILERAAFEVHHDDSAIRVGVRDLLQRHSRRQCRQRGANRIAHANGGIAFRVIHRYILCVVEEYAWHEEIVENIVVVENGELIKVQIGQVNRI